MSCIFCRIAAGEIPAERLFENEHVVAFHDLSPQAPVHVLVIPRLHLENVACAAGEHAGLLGQVLLACRAVAEQTGLTGGGFRIVLNSGPDAGQSVDHMHAHVLGGRSLSWPPG